MHVTTGKSDSLLGKNANMKRRTMPPILIAGCVVGGWLFAGGCTGFQTAGEKAARHDAATVAAIYRPGGERPALPALTENSGLDEYLRFAMLSDPRVEAAYYEWLAAVERITVARSWPDPKLTFQADIQKVVMSLMPGLMLDIPGPGKLSAGAAVASEESTARYYAFEKAVLQTAFDLKKAYYQLYFLEEKVRLEQSTLDLLTELEKLAESQNAVGKVTLHDVLRAQMEKEQMMTDIANLEDARGPLLAQMKAALGLRADQAAPPVPTQFVSTPLDLEAPDLFSVALARNPGLKAMEAEIRQADAGIRLARKARIPDFSAGVEVDVKTAPYLVRPEAGVTLPIWRDKLAAELADAQANKKVAQARLTAEQIALAIEFADKTYAVRESQRNLALLRDRLIPKARQSLELAKSGYQTGSIDFFSLLDAERTLLGFEMAQVDAQTRRELALAELSLVILGLPPATAPLPASSLSDLDLRESRYLYFDRLLQQNRTEFCSKPKDFA